MEQAGDTQSLILRRLRQVEQTEEVRILYACEAGSRAWAYASAASDYDVRFIYVRPVEWYLSIKDQRDVLEFPIHVGAEDDQREAGASGSSQPGNGGALDLVGWDLRKALLLLAKGNPALFEWLASPIVYADTHPLSQRLQALAPYVFSAKAAMHHYLHMAKRNLRNAAERYAGRAQGLHLCSPAAASLRLDRALRKPAADGYRGACPSGSTGGRASRRALGGDRPAAHV